MLELVARKLLRFPVEVLWEKLSGEYRLQFDDGTVIDTDHREIMYSRHMWEYFVAYPDAKILPSLFVKSFLKNGLLTSSTQTEMLSAIQNHIYAVYTDLPHNKLVDNLAKLAYEITDSLANIGSRFMEAEVTSIDILDFIELVEHEPIAQLKRDAKPNERSINDTNKAIFEIIRSDQSLSHNPVAKAVRIGIASPGQVVKCIGLIGFVSDMNSRQFATPIMRSYTEGIRLFGDSLIESRTCSKAIWFTKSPLQQSEYFSRKIQFLDQTVANLYNTKDCGSAHYLHWRVRGAEVEDGIVTRKADLPNLLGKIYVDEEDGNKLKVITEKDTHLVGKLLKLRAVSKCSHDDSYGICGTCFGDLAYGIPDDTNIGHMAAAYLAQKQSQAMLSQKHLNTSVSIEAIRISREDAAFLRTKTTPSDKENSRQSPPSDYYLSYELKRHRSVKLVIPSKFATDLSDIFEVERVEDLNITRVSEIEQVCFVVDDGSVISKNFVDVKRKRRKASLTYDFLNYFRMRDWDLDDTGGFVIDLKEWDYDKPIMSLPLMEANMADYATELGKKLEARIADRDKRDVEISPDAFLMEVFDQVNAQMDVNLAVLEVVVYGTMIRSAAKKDYRLPKPGTEYGLGVLEDTMMNRSAGAYMAFQTHHKFFNNPGSYVYKNRPNHVLDVCLTPREVLESNRRRKYA